MRAAPGKYPEPCCSCPSWDSSDLVLIRAGHWALPGDWCRWQSGLLCPKGFAVLLNTAVGLGLVVLVKCQGKPVATGTQCYQEGESSAQPHCYSNIQPQSLGELKTEFSPCFFFRVLLRIIFFCFHSSAVLAAIARANSSVHVTAPRRGGSWQGPPVPQCRGKECPEHPKCLSYQKAPRYMCFPLGWINKGRRLRNHRIT